MKKSSDLMFVAGLLAVALAVHYALYGSLPLGKPVFLEE
ncbi:hypothetical protein MBEHAL_1488 [Halarchaeum acidiphilum MH1-52-1]|uniref:Uncharacterized protein n=1 Tax=Halarchaeum acidiphilum MH1-52-1 TaxID=1261545 RepID=U3AD73_9EURY|nr:hypothetical protein MBEHAL_1488 [Halarchaeum acidiphilum MH1-52-1]